MRSVAVVFGLLIALGAAQAAPPPPGSTCASVSPSDRQNCINDWLVGLQKANTKPGILGGNCRTVTPSYQQACINGVIDKLAGGKCAAAYGCKSNSCGPKYQDCIMTVAIELQAKAAGRSRPLGASCATMSPASRQDCINSKVLRMQQTATGGAIGGCAGVAPQYTQQCVNSYVLGLMKTSGLVGGCAGVAPANRQKCINLWVDQQAAP